VASLWPAHFGPITLQIPKPEATAGCVWRPFLCGHQHSGGCANSRLDRESAETKSFRLRVTPGVISGRLAFRGRRFSQGSQRAKACRTVVDGYWSNRLKIPVFKSVTWPVGGFFQPAIKIFVLCVNLTDSLVRPHGDRQQQAVVDPLADCNRTTSHASGWHLAPPARSDLRSRQLYQPRPVRRVAGSSASTWPPGPADHGQFSTRGHCRFRWLSGRPAGRALLSVALAIVLSWQSGDRVLCRLRAAPVLERYSSALEPERLCRRRPLHRYRVRRTAIHLSQVYGGSILLGREL